jgi:hypothetical protein
VTVEQWERLKVLFHGALAQPADRQHWLLQHSGGDEMLEREAAALIQAHETAGGFLDTPVAIEPADFKEAMRLEIRATDPLDVLERDIATSVRAHDVARESTDARRRPFDQLMMSIVRRVRQLFD